MPRGSKASYSAKQKRQAKHIEDSSRKKGRSAKSSKRIAWATVNKQTGGAAKKSANPSSRSNSKSASARKKSSANSTSTRSRNSSTSSSSRSNANPPYKRRRRSNPESAYTH